MSIPHGAIGMVVFVGDSKEGSKTGERRVVHLWFLLEVGIFKVCNCFAVDDGAAGEQRIVKQGLACRDF